MPAAFDVQTKRMVAGQLGLNSVTMAGNVRYAMNPVFPDSVPYKYLTAVLGPITLKDGRTVQTGILEEMDQAAKDVVDSSDLGAAKTARRRALKVEATKYFATRYEAEDQEWFRDLFMDAVGSGKTNRRAFIQTWIVWRADAIEHAKDQIVAVNAAVTVAAVNAVVLNTAAMTAQDPAITLGDVLGIAD